jgi:hypothetical protein
MSLTEPVKRIPEATAGHELRSQTGDNGAAGQIRANLRFDGDAWKFDAFS